MKVAIEDKGIQINLDWREVKDLFVEINDLDLDVSYEKNNLKAIRSELDEIFTKEGH